MKNKVNNYILAIDTTSKICGVAVISADRIVTETNLDRGLNHSVTLFDNIDNALKKSRITMKDVDRIKVSNGPGSFTGIRIGISAAVGLSEKYNTKIEYIDTLDALAYNIKGNDDIIISMIDARVDRVYLSVYDSKTLKKYTNDTVANIEELTKLLNRYSKSKNISLAFVGDGAINYKDYFTNNLNVKFKIYDKDSLLRASSVAFAKGKTSKVPVINYLLASKAERERNA